MSTVTRENIGLLNDKIIVKIEKSDYLPSFEKSLKEYGKKANIPGFRKGMVPTSLIKMTQPMDYSFAFEVGLKPAFQLPELSSLTPTRYQIIITDEMLNEEIERLRQKNGTMTDPETATGEENVLNVTFQETDAQGTPTEGSQPKDNSLLVKYFAAAFRSQLLDKKAGDEFIIQLLTAFEDKERAWILQDLGLNKESAADAEKYFRMVIVKVGLLEKAALDETLFK